MGRLDGHDRDDRDTGSLTATVPVVMDLGAVDFTNKNLRLRLQLRGTVRLELVGLDEALAAEQRDSTCEQDLRALDLIVTPGVGAVVANPPERRSRSGPGRAVPGTASSSGPAVPGRSSVPRARSRTRCASATSLRSG
jgi:hypothetical protein